MMPDRSRMPGYAPTSKTLAHSQAEGEIRAVIYREYPATYEEYQSHSCHPSIWPAAIANWDTTQYTAKGHDRSLVQPFVAVPAKRENF
mmetsp:Transcript_14695/g.44365  ORF Transcript_14695/g.44365 Transcript_14695/m.44365 type:complete len:88 (-) Transcript_14695:2937-3200(-)